MATPGAGRDRDEALGGDGLVTALSVYAGALEDRRDHINRINVFPVADADTGSNLVHTMTAVVATLQRGRPLDETARGVAEAAMYAGRGASGIILSQALAGICDRLGATEAVNAADLAAALAAGSEAAYGAVADPVEGTMLTAAARAATRATESAAEGSGLLEVAQAAREGAWQAVAESPSLLAVLRDAGVVDGGAVGFGLLMDALVAVIDGAPLPARSLPTGTAVTLDLPEERYEVVASVVGASAGPLRAELSAVGSSVAVGSGSPAAYVHCHTTNPAAVLSILKLAGSVEQLDVTDLHRQVAPNATGSVVAVAPSPDHVLDLLDAAPDRVIAPGDEARLTQLFESGPGGLIRLVVLREAGSAIRIPDRSEGTVEVVIVDTDEEAVSAIRRRH